MNAHLSAIKILIIGSINGIIENKIFVTNGFNAQNLLQIGQ